jgi:hypothetical protein
MKTVAVSTLLRGMTIVTALAEHLKIERVTAGAPGRTSVYIEGRETPLDLPTGGAVDVLTASALHDVWG